MCSQVASINNQRHKVRISTNISAKNFHFVRVLVFTVIIHFSLGLQSYQYNGSKIFVNPSKTPTVVYYPSVPLVWTEPTSSFLKTTLFAAPTRRPGAIKYQLQTALYETSVISKPLFVYGGTVLRPNNSGLTEPPSSTPKPTHVSQSVGLPPGVSPPEGVVVDPDRGNFVDWILGVVGIRPEKPDQQPTHPIQASGCKPCSCGLAYRHTRIVGGIETLVNEYPWMTILMYLGRFYCGASVINNKFVLTAAHCVSGFQKERLTAVFLDHDRSTSQETMSFTRKISDIIRHKSYNVGASYNNDIALLRLDRELIFSGKLRPVCLPALGKSYTGFTGVVIGWGATVAHGQVSNKLREVKVPILSNVACRKTGYGTKISDNMLCAGYSYGTKDSCQGDSGGPLHILNGSYFTQVGIVSWGEGCAEPNYPGVYTRVNRYISWIKSNTKDACYC